LSRRCRNINKKDILILKNRNKIYNIISKHPGIHLRKICEEINISDSTIRYHIKYLNKNGLIEEKKQDGYSRYFCNDKQIGYIEKEILQAIRQKTRLEIVLFLFINVCSSNLEISKNLEKDFKTITFHLNKLKKMGIIETTEIKNGLVSTNYRKTNYMEYKNRGREKAYVLKNPYLIYLLLKKNRDKLFYGDFIEEAIEFYENCIKEKPDNFFYSSKSNAVADRIFKCVLNVFPIPFCA